MGEITIMTQEEYQKTTARIRENLAGIVEKFVYVGWLLNKIAKSEGYKVGGYATIAEYAKAELGGMKADTVSRFINVFKTYGASEETPELKEEYKAYRYSMLVEMLQLPEEDREMITPDTPRETIRELNRFNAEQNSGVDVLFGWQQDSAELMRTAVKELVKVYEESKIREILKMESKVRHMTEMLCPSGSRTFKKGMVFLILTTENIKVKIFGRENKEISWEQLTDLITELIPPAVQEPEIEKIPEEDITVEDPDTLPGQDNILNHPEFMPDPEPEKEEIAPAQKTEKTEEQKYAEKQAAIDRKTKQKLEEIADEEKMEHLPCEAGPATHQIRVGISYIDEMESGRSFDLRKKEKIKIGDYVEYMGFKDNKYTGKTYKVRVTFILDEAAGLEEGFYILGLQKV